MTFLLLDMITSFEKDFVDGDNNKPGLSESDMYGSSDADDCSKRSNLREQTSDVSCQINISIIETLQEDMHWYRSTLNKEYVSKNHSSGANQKAQENIVSLSSKVMETFVKKEPPKCSKCDVIFPTMLDVQRHQLLDAEKCQIFKKYITKSKDEEIGDSFKQTGDHNEDISWGQNESSECMPLILSCMTSDPRMLGEDIPVRFDIPSKEFGAGTSDIKIEVADDETNDSCPLIENNNKLSEKNDSSSDKVDTISRKVSQPLFFVYNNENYPLLMEEDLSLSADVDEPVSGTSDIKIEITAGDETNDSCSLREGNYTVTGKNDSSSEEIDTIYGKESESLSFVYNNESYPLLMERDLLLSKLVSDITSEIKIEVITGDETNDSCPLTDCNNNLSEVENASNNLKSNGHQDSVMDVNLGNKVLNRTSIDRKVSQVSPSSFVLDQNYKSSDRLRIQAMLENIKLNQQKAPLLQKSQCNVISLSELPETTPKRKKIEDVSIHENVRHKKFQDNLSEGSKLGDENRSEKNSNHSQLDVASTTRITEDNTLSHFQCPLCDKNFSCLSRLNRHKTVHSGEMPFSCSVCNKCFRRKDGVASHQKNAQKLSCQMCKQPFCNFVDLKLHEKSHSERKVHFCYICGIGFNEKYKLQRHKKSKEHIDNLSKRCYLGDENQSVKKSDQSQLDVASTTRIDKENTHSHFQCPMCDKNFSSLGILNRHKIAHNGKMPFSCLVCHKCFRQKGGLVSHQKNAQKLSCRMCKQAFCKFFDLKVHEKRHSTRKLHFCYICDIGFYQKYKLQRHEKSKGHINSLKTTDNCYSTSDDHWNKKNRNIEQNCRKLSAESQKASHNKKYVSNIGKVQNGSKLFDTKKDKTHENSSGVLENMSRTQGKYKCKILSKSNNAYRIQKVTIYQCDKCHRHFKSYTTYLKHQNNHKAYRHKCNICDKLFSKRRLLENHQKICQDNSIHISGSAISSICSIKNSKHFENNKLDCKYVNAEPIGKQSQNSMNKESQNHPDLSKNTRSNIVLSHSINSNVSKHCEECGKVFSSVSSLKNHETIHSGIRPFACLWCHASFRRKDTLGKHRRRGRKLTCSLCRKRFCNSSKLREHKAAEHNNSSHISGSTISSNCSIKNSKYFENNELDCEYINAEPIGKQSSKEHEVNSSLKTNGAIRKLNQNSMNKESQNHPDLSKNTKSNMVLSSINSNVSKQCEESETAFSSVSSSKNHMTIHSGIRPFACLWCHASFRRKDTLAKHKRRGRKLSCRLCRKQFCNSSKLRKHEATEHSHIESHFKRKQALNGKGSSAKVPNAVSSETSIKDNLKRSQLKGKNELNCPPKMKHLKYRVLKSKEYQFKCEICEKSYAFERSLKRHKRLNHNNNLSEGCKLGDENRSEKNLNHSQLDVASTTRITEDNTLSHFQCPLCDKNFSCLSRLNRHKTVHSGEMPFSCSVCNKCFRRKDGVASHQKNAQKLSCQMCKQPFCNFVDLKLHEKSHSERKVHFCYICDIGFNEKYKLQRHKKSKEHIGKPTYCSELQTTQPEAIDADSNPMKAGGVIGNVQYDSYKKDTITTCPDQLPVSECSTVVPAQISKKGSSSLKNSRVCGDCGKIFANWSSLKQHQIIHTRFKPFSCTWCKYCFGRNDHLLRHKRRAVNLCCDECNNRFCSSKMLRLHVLKQHTQKETTNLVKTDEKIPDPAVGGGLLNSEKEIIEDHNGRDRSFTDETDIHFEKGISVLEEGRVKVSGNNISNANIDILSGTMLEEERNLKKEQLLEKPDCYDGRKCDGFSIPPNQSRHEHYDKYSPVFHCDQCNKVFSSNFELQVHKVVHAEHEYYECVTCNKQFAQISSLRKHQTLLNHKVDNPYNIKHIYQKKNVSANSIRNCNSIDNQRSTNQKYMLKVNKESNNGQDREVPMVEDHQQNDEIKNKSPKRKHFTNRTFLLQRMRAEKDEHDKKSCIKEDVTETRYNKEFLINTQSIPKPYVCKICRKGFLYASDLRRHEAFHMNVVTNTDVVLRPYKCKKCNRRFSLRTKFICHQKRHFAKKCNVDVKPLRSRIT